MHLRTLKRRLIDLGLKRKGKTEMDKSEIELLIRREIEGAGSLAFLSCHLAPVNSLFPRFRKTSVSN